MEHEPLPPFLHHLIDDLFVAAGRADGDYPQALRLPAGEQCRSVRTGKDADLAGDIAQFVRPPAVEPLPSFEDRLAHILLQQAIDDLGDRLLQLGRFILVEGYLSGECLHCPHAECLHELIPFLLARTGADRGEFRPYDRPGALFQRRISLIDQRHELLFCRLNPVDEPFLQGDELLDRAVGEADHLYNLLLGEFVHLPLDHRHRLLRSGDGDIDTALFLHIDTREDDQSAVFPTDIHTGYRPGERGRGDRQSSGSTEDPKNFRRAIRLNREDGSDQLHLIHISVGEERADRSVDHPRA